MCDKMHIFKQRSARKKKKKTPK